VSALGLPSGAARCGAIATGPAEVAVRALALVLGVRQSAIGAMLAGRGGARDEMEDAAWAVLR